MGIALPISILIYQYLKTSGKMHLFTQALCEIKHFNLIPLQMQGLCLTSTEQKPEEAFVYSFPTFLPFL